MDKKTGDYARASEELAEKLYLLKGQWFYKSDACEVCGVNGYKPYKDGTTPQQLRDAIGQVLYNWSHKEPLKLEQKDKKYWVIENEFRVVKPKVGQGSRYDLRWPYGIGDNSTFSFAESAVVFEGDVVGLGGEGNKGKTAFAIDLAVENCDIHNVTLVCSENVHRLDERLEEVDWKEIYTPDKSDWLFEIIEEKNEQTYLDIVRARKDNLVIIDWLDASKDTYLIGQFYRAASDRIDKGVVMIIQQKRSYKEFAVGGEAPRDYSGVFLLIQTMADKSSVLYVDKVKSYDHFNPERMMYRFEIENKGSRFNKIHEVETCHSCKGKGYTQSSGVSSKCSVCWGAGYIDVIGEL